MNSLYVRTDSVKKVKLKYGKIPDKLADKVPCNNISVNFVVF